MMTLDLAVATYGPDGISRVAAMVLPPVEGLRYIVSWQAHGDAPIPAELIRPDVEIHRFHKTGLSNNRNNAIDHCFGDIVLFSDDDIIYTTDQLSKIRTTFTHNKSLDLATFRTSGESKQYPPAEAALHACLPKNFSVSSIEIAFRRATAGNLRCCPELGLNSPKLHGGEDEMFLMSAIRRGLDCRFFPITICEHPGASTGTKAHFTNENLQASGCVIALTRPWTAILRVPLKAWRVSRKGQASFLRALYRISRGALMAPGVLKRNHKYLW